PCSTTPRGRATRAAPATMEFWVSGSLSSRLVTNDSLSGLKKRSSNPRFGPYQRVVLSIEAVSHFHGWKQHPGGRPVSFLRGAGRVAQVVQLGAERLDPHDARAGAPRARSSSRRRRIVARTPGGSPVVSARARASATATRRRGQVRGSGSAITPLRM